MRTRILRATIVLLALISAHSTWAAPPPLTNAAIVGACIRASSTSQPWLEKTLWGLYDQERGWVGAEILNRDGSRDLGPMQVNSRWANTVATLLHRSSPDVYRWLRDDACFNVGIASWLFLSGYRQAQDYWVAVGVYHSPTKWRARTYAENVAARLRRRYGDRVFQRPGK